MINFEIKYNGKSYNSIEDAMTIAIIDGIKETYTKALAPFESEIKANNGEVSINVSQNLENVKIDLRNMPEDLIERIKKVL
ncbi:MAG: hypothetical protein JNK98_09040 [Chitinophagaceae bacterium]|nr:hypothetical protein [Chitinophagaceae bacterium]